MAWAQESVKSLLKLQNKVELLPQLVVAFILTTQLTLLRCVSHFQVLIFPVQGSRLFVESDGLGFPFCKLRGQKFKLLLKFRLCQVFIRAATVDLASLRVLGRRHYEMILAFRRADETKH